MPVLFVSTAIDNLKAEPIKKFINISNEENVPISHGQCQVISSENLMKYGKVNQFQNGIPRLIHYVYKTTYIPTQYSLHVKQCMVMNNESKFVFWTDFTSYMFIIENYPNHLDIYSSYFAKFSDRLKISDIIRYFLLLKFGGIYMDLDTSCHKPFQPVLINESCLLSTEIHEQSRIMWNMEYLAMNSFMMCLAGHEFFQYLVRKLPKADNSSVVSQTGPIMLTNRFNSYVKRLSRSNSTDRLKAVSLANAYTFSAYSEPFLENLCRGECRVAKICRNIGDCRRSK